MDSNKHHLFFILFLLLLISGSVCAQTPADYGRTWQDYPVIPELSDTARAVLRAGIEAGHNPHAFSKVGDCETDTQWYLADYDKGPMFYNLGEYEYLAPVLEYFKGSFIRNSIAALPGFSAASVLSPMWVDYTYCTWEEKPLSCEFRIHDPLIVLISLGTNDGYNPSVFKENLRQIIELTLADLRLPVLMLKADNVEGDFSINQDIVDLAENYDIPVWNYWAAIQHLYNHGLQEDGIHLSFYQNNFSDPNAWDRAWPYRNLTALQILGKLQYEIELIINEQ